MLLCHGLAESLKPHTAHWENKTVESKDEGKNAKIQGIQQTNVLK